MSAEDPTSLEQRVQRLEAREAIRQLVARHALAVDRRDLDELLRCYAPGAPAPDGTSGPGALRSWFDLTLREVGTTFHLLGGHVIDLHDDLTASGALQCRAEYEVDGAWIVAALHHEDRYELVDGEWRIGRRDTHTFYAADVAAHPLRVPGRKQLPEVPPGAPADVPERWRTWQEFWGGSAPIGTPVPQEPRP